MASSRPSSSVLVPTCIIFLSVGINPFILEFFIENLQAASTPEVREERPWIIVYAHRPMYCSNADTSCIPMENRVRVGVAGAQV